MCTEIGQKTVCIVVIYREINVCCRVMVVNIQLFGDSSDRVCILVAQEKHLEFDLLISMNTIKELGGIIITPSEVVSFLGSKPSL